MAILWKPWASPRSRFGDVALVAFLLVQLFDGVLTYLGIITYGPGAEGNPVISSMMQTFGHAGGLMTAKFTAAGLGAALHFRRVHGLIAALTGLYVAAAIVPWAALLFL
jgi:Domain of unknown function (DUF5658)